MPFLAEGHLVVPCSNLKRGRTPRERESREGIYFSSEAPWQRFFSLSIPFSYFEGFSVSWQSGDRTSSEKRHPLWPIDWNLGPWVLVECAITMDLRRGQPAGFFQRLSYWRPCFSPVRCAKSPIWNALGIRELDLGFVGSDWLGTNSRFLIVLQINVPMTILLRPLSATRPMDWLPSLKMKTLTPIATKP